MDRSCLPCFLPALPAELLYPSGLFRKPLRCAVKRAVVNSPAWLPGSYLVLDTGKQGGSSTATNSAAQRSSYTEASSQTAACSNGPACCLNPAIDRAPACAVPLLLPCSARHAAAGACVCRGACTLGAGSQCCFPGQRQRWCISGGGGWRQHPAG